MDLKLSAILVILVNFVQSKMTFDQWQAKYNIRSPPIHYDYDNCKQAFDVSVAFIAVNKLRYKIEYKLSLNGLADLSSKRFKDTCLGIVLPKISERGNRMIYATSQEHVAPSVNYTQVSTPASVDYRNSSLPVQNQKNCNSCWAFSAIETLECKMKMKNSSFSTLLSEQYLLDCDTWNYGCKGGWPTSAFNWIAINGGNAVPAMTSYQYYGFQQNCKATAKIAMNIKVIIQNYTAGNENMMKEIVAKVGPVAAAMDSTSYFQLYSSGIFYDTTCNTKCTSANHAVVIIGYGTDPTTKKDYWIIKNSWGTAWGENGYGYILRNKGNQCNIACWAMYAL